EHLITTNSIVVYKICFETIGIFNILLNRGEDLDLWARLSEQFDIIKSQEVTTMYRRGEENSLTKGKSDYYKSVLSIIQLKGKSNDEKKYWKKMIVKRLKRSVKELDLIDILRILIKYNIQLFI